MKWELRKQTNTEAKLEAERLLLNEALAHLAAVESKMDKAPLRGRLLFGLDLTGSREAALHQARIATSGMFKVLKKIGAIDLKLAWYRGDDEFQTSAWHGDPDSACQAMLKLTCESGLTQIGRLLQFALAEKEQLSAVVLIVDHCEETPGRLCDLAHGLKQKSVPLFVFHECSDLDPSSLKAKPVLKRLAELSAGAYVEFKADSGDALRELLAAVAAFSAHGVEGMKRLPPPVTTEAQKLHTNLRLMLGSGDHPRPLR